MEVRCLKLGYFRAHCYLLVKGNKALIIDPGAEPEKIIGDLEGLTVQGILITHGHFDHLGALPKIKSALKAPLYLQEEILPEYQGAKKAAKEHGFNIPDLPEPDFLLGARLEIGVFSGEVLRTPGHSAGSVCFLFDNFLFSGDTLFKGTCGRTDLLLSDEKAMRHSLKKLSELPPETKVYPGHGHFAVLGDEIPWMKRVSNLGFSALEHK